MEGKQAREGNIKASCHNALSSIGAVVGQGDIADPSPLAPGASPSDAGNR